MAEEMELMMQLAELGFPPERIQRALKATDCKGLDAALDYLQNEFDPPATKAVVDEEEESKEPIISKPIETVVEKVTEQTSTTAGSSETASSSTTNNIVTVDELQQKLAEKRKLEAVKEEQASREQELKRRQEGKEMLALKRQRDALERQKLVDERKKAMEDERRRKERVLAMIAEDRASQNQPIITNTIDQKSDDVQMVKEEQSTTSTSSDNVRIMVRGAALGKQLLLNLSGDCTLDDVIAHIEEEHPDIMTRHRLIIALPHREFERAEYSKSLIDLGLAPSVLLTLAPKISSSS